MIKNILISYLLFSSINLFSQNSLEKIETPTNVRLGYNSSIIYPGLKAGLEIPIRKKQIEKTKKSGKQKRYFKDRFLTANFGWYHHKTFHDNVYLTAGYTFRRTHNKGFFTELSPEIGYSRTFLGGTTYRVDDNVSIKKGAGYNYALVSFGGGLGYDFSITKSKPIAIYYKLNLLTMFPYNSTIYLRPTMELGIIYKPSKFLMFKPKTKHITKDNFQK